MGKGGTSPSRSRSRRIDPNRLSPRRSAWIENRIVRWGLLAGFAVTFLLTVIYAVLLAWPDAKPTSSTNCSTVSTYDQPSPDPVATSEPSEIPLDESSRVVTCQEKAMPAWVLALGPVLMGVLIVPELLSFYGSFELDGEAPGGGKLRVRLTTDNADAVTADRVSESQVGVKRRKKAWMDQLSGEG